MKTDLIHYFTYYLALQKCHNNSPYTIHGLWIDYARGGYPEFCKKTTFNETVLYPIQNSLHKNWPGCYGKSNDLWKHEWLKHGTCFYPYLDLFKYFNTTLHLFSIIDSSHCKNKDCLIPIDYDQI